MPNSAPEILHSLLPFISDTVWNYILYEFLVPGFLAMIGLGFAKLFGWKPTKWEGLGFCVRLFFVALLAIFVFRAPSANSNTSTHTELLPVLKAQPSSLAMMPSPNKPSDTLIMIGLTIYNAGAPSVVRNWALIITGSDKNEFNPTLITTTKPAPDISPAPIAIPVPNIPHTAQGMQLGMDDYLVQKADQPIVSGGQIDGWLVFDLQDVSFDYLKSNATKFEVNFSDVADQKYSIPMFSQVPATAPK